MNERVEKQNAGKSKAAANNAIRKKSNVKQGFTSIDNWHKSAVQKKTNLISANNNRSILGKSVFQLARELDLGIHGKAQIPEGFKTDLEPDIPKFGATISLLGDNIASSMEAIVTPNHPQGSSPKSQNTLFKSLPTKGSYKILSNLNQPKNGSTLYIKGHLLNDNLGGPGSEENLFPITHQANVDHDNKIEEPIKDRVNKEGGVVYYKVVAQKTSGPTDTNLKDEMGNWLKSVNGRFDCTVMKFNSNPESPVITKTETINSVWGGTDNSNKDKFVFEKNFAKANAFDKDKVKIMPRAQIKEEWDKAYMDIATSIAVNCGINLDQWLQKTVDGIGKKGSDLLNSTLNYETLSKADKGTLNKAQNTLKKFIGESYSVYLNILQDVDKDDTIADEDKYPAFDLQKVVNLTVNSLKSFEDILQHSPVFITKEFENPPKSFLKTGASLYAYNSTWAVWKFNDKGGNVFEFLLFKVGNGLIL